MNKIFTLLAVSVFTFLLPAYANENTEKNFYPDYAEQFLVNDKFESFNRKMFYTNAALNKYAVRPISILWASIMPKYGMDRLKYAYSNILYPRRFVSTLLQGDIKATGQATARFLVNSTIGLAGMFDPAKRFLNIEPINENMEQALAKLKMKQGPYLVLPVLSSTTPRAILGRALDSALDPTCYIGAPVIAAIKAGLTLNNAAINQPLAKTIELSFIDPYDILKKLYGLQSAIYNSNYDRRKTLEKACIEAKNKEDVLNNLSMFIEDENFLNIADIIENKTTFNLEDVIKGGTSTDEILFEETLDDNLKPDIILENFNPQHPVIDSMRTALFEADDMYKSMWSEMSVWNRSFQNRIKSDTVEIFKGREKYKFKYIMQKDKNSPMAIIFPSIGEGADNHHSANLAKIFYDEGYSVTILGSAFHYNFVKSMPENYAPGIPDEDVKYIKKTTAKILENLEEKFNCKFKNKVVLGTSFGAISSLFLAESEQKENLLNISKYISICPPVELMYAINAIDKTAHREEKDEEKLKDKMTMTGAKIMHAYNEKEGGKIEENFKNEHLPFNLEEAKLITSFVLHQKLLDLMFALENINPNKKTDFYKTANNMSYKDYAQKYLANGEYSRLASFEKEASLHKIREYLKNNSNYRIYHSMDDYLVTENQLKQLRNYSKNKLTLIDKGAHLGFLYRKEFLDDLKKEISTKEKI